MNNHVWYHNASEDSKALVTEREYLSTVDAVKLSSQYAVVLSDGRVSIHAIAPGSPADRGTMVRAAGPRTSPFQGLGAVCHLKPPPPHHHHHHQHRAMSTGDGWLTAGNICVLVGAGVCVRCVSVG
jgi:hypothetical protein